MGEQILDGKGKGYLAHIDSENRLMVYSTVESELSHESETNKQAYVLLGEAIPGITASGICSMVNDSTTKNLIIQKVVVATEENTSATAMTKFGFWKNPTTNSGGVSATPVNLNFSSSLTADCTCLEDNDGTTLTISGGDSVTTVRLMGANSFTVNFEGSLILGRGSIFAVKGATDNAAIKVRAGIYFYFHEIK